MRSTVRLGRVAGVEVGVHWSVLAIFVLLVAGLSSNFPAMAPGYPRAVYLVTATVAAVLFVLSLLAHEMAHAVIARRNGVEVEGITLWLLGGVARLRGEAPTPGADFRISAVGPFTSLVLGAAFGGAAWLGRSVGLDDLTLALLDYLAAINVILAVFNSIPAAPLDGGRILRAAVWAWRGDRVVAAVVAARAGRIFGFALIALGVLQAIAGGIGGLWWMLIGLFVVSMAGAEEHHARTSSALAGITVGDVMTPRPEAVDGGLTVDRFVHEVALRRRHATFPLLDRTGRLQGLITLNRIREVPAEQRPTTRLVDVACPPDQIPMARPDEPLTALLTRLRGCTDGRALVFAETGPGTGESLVGIVSPSDISRTATLHGLGARFAGGGGDIIELGGQDRPGRR